MVVFKYLYLINIPYSKYNTFINYFIFYYSILNKYIKLVFYNRFIFLHKNPLPVYFNTSKSFKYHMLFIFTILVKTSFTCDTVLRNIYK